MATQRSDAISFIGLILAYGWFAFGVLADGLGQPGLIGRVLGFYIRAAVALALLQVAAEWVFGARPEGDREFEREIGRRSGRNAYIAMLSVLWAAPFLLALPYGVELTLATSVGVMGLAELVRYGSRLVYRALGPGRLGTGRNQRAVAG